MASLLETQAPEVVVAHDAPSALRQARAQRLDVFILDIGLPDMDGNELAARLRGVPQTLEICLSAHSLVA